MSKQPPEAGAEAQRWVHPDGKGKIELLEVFGSDLTVVNAARVSFAKVVTEMTPKDEKLINYLATNDHVSPFFHPQVRFRIKMPIFVVREWYRHQVGLTRNEVSRRYVDDRPETWNPSPGEVRARDLRAKQGSKEEAVADAEGLCKEIQEFNETAIQMYEKLLGHGVAPEIARGVLPQSMYTEFIETGSLAAYARIWKLRTDPHAQREIQVYARAIGMLLEPRFPVSWKSLTQESGKDQ